MGHDFTTDEKKAELGAYLKVEMFSVSIINAFINFHQQQTQSSIPEVPQGLATSTESVCAKLLKLISQYSKDLDRIIKNLNTDKEAKTKKQGDLEKELESVDIIYYYFPLDHSYDLYK